MGFYTLLAASLIGPTGQVYAFEPFPPNLGYLERHLSLNQITNARVFGVAVTDRDGALRFRSQPQRTNGRLDDSGDLLRGLGYRLQALDSPDEWYVSRPSALRG